MNRKLIITITISVLLAILVVLLVYNFFLKNGRPIPETVNNNLFATPEEATQASTSSGSQEPLRPVFFDQIASFSVGQDGANLVLMSGFGVELNLQGMIQNEYDVLSGSTLVDASVSPDENRIAVQDGFGSWYLSSQENGVIESLPPQITSVSFSPSGVAAMVEEDKGASLVSIQNGGGVRTIFTSQIPDLEANWTNNNILALSTTPSGTAPGILYLLNTNTGGLTRLLGNRYGLTSIVSPDTNWVVFSETESSGRNMIVKYLDTQNDQENVLSVQTMPEKCVFSAEESSVLYCATLNASPRTHQMPDDYRKGVFENSTSDLVRIELATGVTSTIQEDMSVDPVSLKLSDDEQVLFFINKKDGSLWRLSL